MLVIHVLMEKRAVVLLMVFGTAAQSQWVSAAEMDVIAVVMVITAVRDPPIV